MRGRSRCLSNRRLRVLSYPDHVNDAVRRFGQTVSALDAEIDWSRLGRSYCDGDAATFFDDSLRSEIIESGLRLADDVAAALGSNTAGRSLYLGAAVAELAPILMESLVLAREVVWLNLACDETREITRALDIVGARLGIELPRPRTDALEGVGARGCNHLWMVSVLTDPDAFPALHDDLYERARGPLATGRGSLADDRARATALANALLDRATSPCVLTSTDEELAFLRPILKQRGLRWKPSGVGRLSAIVGDRVGSIHLRAL